MRFVKETVHEPKKATTNQHMSSGIIETKPFRDARVKQGGYGVLTDDFWLYRPPNKGFIAFVYTFSGSGHLIMDDGSKYYLRRGDLFISSSTGQGHFEEVKAGEVWESLWITFWPDSFEFIPKCEDYEIIKFENINDLRTAIKGIFREEHYGDIKSESAIELYEELLLINIKRSSHLNEDYAMHRYRQEFSLLWSAVSNNLSDDWSMERVTSFTGYSKSHITRLCLSLYGKSPTQIILSIRMRHAKVLLLNSSQSIEAISLAVGYSRLSSFSYAFSQYYNTSPRSLRLGVKNE